MGGLFNNPFALALATLVGTIVGAGIFGLPYVTAKAGVALGVFYLVLLGVVVMLLHLMFGEIALRTQAKCRLIGYASLYLGGWAKKLVTLSTVVGIVGALLAYTILGGDFLRIALGSFIPLPNFAFAIVFWLIFSLFILRGIQTIARMELFFNIALFLVVGAIFVFAFPYIQTKNLILLDFSYPLLPYGVVLFAYLGLSAIPETAELFKRSSEKQHLDNLIVWASIISGALFLVFTLVVVGVSGAATSQDALTGLIPFLGEKVAVLGALFGLIVIATSFLVLGNYLKNSLRYDYHMPYGLACALTIFPPIFLFLIGLREFILVIGLVGALVAALEGSVIALVYRIAKKKGDREPEYSLSIPRPLLFTMVALLLLGAVFEFFF
ncbi:MAG: hypothetical protein A3G10_00385 [Candidatus Wildermuthbacteria bacterium RIFCSPLOWO2_12_FULL_49_9]|nr:MAG: hypothetical protein A3G10_00385 [Candidatus Wildermuthbacteria bacterium RIFCSPLOWO2_12_FULL_49_9]